MTKGCNRLPLEPLAFYPSVAPKPEVSCDMDDIHCLAAPCPEAILPYRFLE
jgi:hypothetical protein